MLKGLADNLCREGCVKGPIMQIAPVAANEDTYVKGLYFATKADAEEHIQNKEIFVRDIMQELKDSDVVAYNEILCYVCILHVDTVVGIHNIMVEQDTMHCGTSTLTLVLPKNLFSFNRAQFGDLAVAQKLLGKLVTNSTSDSSRKNEASIVDGMRTHQTGLSDMRVSPSVDTNGFGVSPNAMTHATIISTHLVYHK